MSVDPVRLPPVGWLFIHQLTLLRPGEIVTDSEGRWEPAEDVPVPVAGYLTVTGRQEQELANAMGVQIDAVASLGRDAQVTEDMRLRAQGIDPYLDGTYRITAVRPTPVHLRVLLTRVVGLDTAR